MESYTMKERADECKLKDLKQTSFSNYGDVIKLKFLLN